MKFLLEVSLDDGAPARDPAAELGRILRYWGGNLRHCSLEEGASAALYDSEHHEVGQWRVVAS